MRMNYNSARMCVYVNVLCSGCRVLFRDIEFFKYKMVILSINETLFKINLFRPQYRTHAMCRQLHTKRGIGSGCSVCVCKCVCVMLWSHIYVYAYVPPIHGACAHEHDDDAFAFGVARAYAHTRTLASTHARTSPRKAKHNNTVWRHTAHNTHQRERLKRDDDGPVGAGRANADRYKCSRLICIARIPKTVDNMCVCRLKTNVYARDADNELC